MTSNAPRFPSSVKGSSAAKASTGQPSFWQRHALKLMFIALVALGIYDIFGAHGVLAMYRTRRQLRQLQGELNKLNEENKQLSDQVNALKTDPDAIERIAREQMGLARPNEKIFKLPPPAANSDGSSPAH